MSGPKSSSYVVVESVADRVARDRRALDAQATSLEAEIAAIQSSALSARNTHGNSIDVPNLSIERPTELSAFRAALADASRELERSKERLAHQIQAARIGTIVESLDGHGESAAALLGADGTAPAAREWKGDVKASIERARDRVDPEAGDDELDELDRLTRMSLEATDEAGAQRGLDAVRIRVGEISERLSAVRSNRTQCGQLLADLSDISIDPADRYRAQVKALLEVGEAPTRELRAAIEQLVKEAKAQEDRRRVAAALHESFIELGYTVGETFETDLVAHGFADVLRSEWLGYGVRVTLPESASVMTMNVVRGTSSDPDQGIRDREVEESFCSDYAEIQSDLPEEGLAIETISEKEPGAVPVQVVSTMPAIGAEAEAKKKHKPRARKRDSN